ncbi:DUF3127 domain-containing protein [Olivibacter sp. LS-1]|uniref:DUF3127 domain-containing protein n=1 Tax=Olivibacter sp. LS-1 TaxID=2592345 RepID=UPI0011EAC41A|nr:DUF3127 domain-containing protein [Olivibacter sp. LS-1]QEL01096.1 DUF3127 domain-containing protein [Olivibacter sp. LS-1]
MEITGIVHIVEPTQQVTDSFKKRDLIVKYAENPQFEEYIKFEATQDRVNIFDSLSVGDSIKVSFNLRGRPWTNKDGVTTYFNSLVAWRVDKLSSGSAPTPEPFDLGSSPSDDDGLPF